jgi:hypothetical protein
MARFYDPHPLLATPHFEFFEPEAIAGNVRESTITFKRATWLAVTSIMPKTGFAGRMGWGGYFAPGTPTVVIPETVSPPR